MSMQNYALDEYAMLLDKDLVVEILKNMDIGYDDEDPVYSLYKEGLCEYQSEFTGEVFGITDSGATDWKNEKFYRSDTVVYFPLRSYCTLFKAAYRNMDEIINELEDAFGEYLPEDFDYRSRICRITGTYYG